MKLKNRLLFITVSFPYSIAKEDSFIVNELEILSKYFDEILILPSTNLGKKSKLPKNCWQI